ncbi:MAG: SIS domain-containing protein [Coriobacteriia bacterium]|nr:SIS domain-containing protein [Coriobacteriia bacterium]
MTDQANPNLSALAAKTAQETGEFPNLMLKEIFEQPRVLREVVAGRLDQATNRLTLNEVTLTSEQLAEIRHIYIIACGTSSHAGLIAKDLIERWTDLTVDVQIASEFVFNRPQTANDTMAIAISQSGETSDTLNALRQARANNAYIIAITNVLGSTITVESDATINVKAEVEAAVPATKSYTAQLATLALLALYLGQERQTLTSDQVAEYYSELSELGDKIALVLSQPSLESITKAAQFTAEAKSVLFLGRGNSVTTCKEGALKLKETSYLHAEAFPALEFLHGPIALIEPEDATPIVALLPVDPNDDSMNNVFDRVKSYGARLVVFATTSATKSIQNADRVIILPEASALQTPFVTAVALQLFAHDIATSLNRDIDRPRYLSKVVVEE